MNWLDLALPLVQRFEGCRLHAYPDPATGGDPWTIGWGHTGPDVHPGLVWTQRQADEALRRELAGFGERVDALVIVPLQAHELAALASFAYNVGIGNFRGSTLLRKLNAGDRVGAAYQFLRWNRAAGRVMRGLTIRRAAERALFVGANG
jgi:lysozyme